jgi:hypothetical protein
MLELIRAVGNEVEDATVTDYDVDFNLTSTKHPPQAGA